MKASVVTAEALPWRPRAPGMWLWGGEWAHTGGAGDWVAGLGVRNEAFVCMCVCVVGGKSGAIFLSVWELKLGVLCWQKWLGYRRGRKRGLGGQGLSTPAGHYGHFSLQTISCQSSCSICRVRLGRSYFHFPDW